MRHAALMLLGGGGAAGIFGDDQVKTQLPGVAGGGFDADVGGDTAENNGVDTAAAQLKLKVGAIERAPLAFGHFDIALPAYPAWPGRSTSVQAAYAPPA